MPYDVQDVPNNETKEFFVLKILLNPPYYKQKFVLKSLKIFYKAVHKGPACKLDYKEGNLNRMYFSQN